MTEKIKIKTRYTHHNLFRSFLAGGMFAVIFGVVLLVDYEDTYNLVFGIAMIVGGCIKLYGAFTDYKTAKTGLLIVNLTFIALAGTLALGMRVQSPYTIFVFYAYLIVKMIITMKEPPYPNAQKGGLLL